MDEVTSWLDVGQPDGELFKARRQAVHLTQERLARAADISLFCYNQIEVGKRAVSTAEWKRLHDVLTIFERAEEELKAYRARTA